MKIIENNTRVTCSKCKSVYEYDNHDIKKEYRTERYLFSSDTYVHYFVRCPICGTKHWIRKELYI